VTGGLNAIIYKASKGVTMKKFEAKRVTFHRLLTIVLGLTLVFSFGCSTKPSPKTGMDIVGLVTEYQGGVPAKGIEVKLYTYHPNPLIEYLPPTGHVIDSDTTTEEGKYRLQVDTDLFRRLEELGYNKLVVFVAPGISGFKIIDLAEGIVEVDLITGAPAPAGTK